MPTVLSESAPFISVCVSVTEDDWESSHYSKVREIEANPPPLHQDDVIIEAIPSANHIRKAFGEDEEVVLLSCVAYQICWSSIFPLPLSSLP